MTATTTGPTLDADLYSFATMQMERRAKNRIDQAIDTEGLSAWFGEQLRNAYQAGLRDGYVQGRHDKHKAQAGEGQNS
jgi:hypothetical protein